MGLSKDNWRMSYADQFVTSYKNWQTIVQNRPDSGVYPGYYCDEKEHSYIDDKGARRTILAPVPHEEQALDYRAWKVYVYARDAYLANL